MATRIMAMGDSLANHQIWRRRLVQMLVGRGYAIDMIGGVQTGADFDMDNEGHGGFTLAQLTAGVPGWLAANPPDIVILVAGTAAAWNRETDLRQRMTTLLKAIKVAAPEAVTLVSTLPPFNAALAGADRAQAAADLSDGLPAIVAARACEGQRVRLVDAAGSLPLAAMSTIDGIHPSAGGYCLISEALLEPVMELLPTPPIIPPSGLLSPRPIPDVRTTPRGGGNLWVEINALGQGNTRMNFTLDGAINVAVYDMAYTPYGATMTVQTIAAGQPTYIAYTVTDACGAWPCSVSRGPNAY